MKKTLQRWLKGNEKSIGMLLKQEEDIEKVQDGIHAWMNIYTVHYVVGRLLFCSIIIN